MKKEVDQEFFYFCKLANSINIVQYLIDQEDLNFEKPKQNGRNLCLKNIVCNHFWKKETDEYPFSVIYALTNVEITKN